MSGEVELSGTLTIIEAGEAQTSASKADPAKHAALRDKLKRLGFTNASRMRLYGEEFELLGDPIVVADDVVFFDAIEKKSRQSRRVRIPRTIVSMANFGRAA
jgi:hypothetical protein